MNARVIRIYSVCCFALSSLNAALGAAELPTVEAVLNTYQENRDQLSTLHVQLKHTREWTQAYRTWNTQQVEQVAGKLKLIETAIEANEGKPLATIPDFGLTNQQIVENLRNTLELTRLSTTQTADASFFEFFLDGENYQVRYPLTNGDLEPADEVEFPRIPVTSASLQKDFSKFRIYSRRAGSTPAAQIWTGHMRPDSKAQALLTARHLWETRDVPLPPMLGKLNPTWSRQHPMDRFFRAAAPQYRVSGVERRDGRELLIVDATIPTEFKETSLDANGKLQEKTVTHYYRAWLDLKRGAIPITLHFWHGYDDRDIDWFLKFEPYKIVTTKKLIQLETGACYPAVTVEEEMSRDPTTPEPTEEEWAEIRAGKKQLKKAVYERRTWNCILVASQFPHEADFFLIEFPEGQEFFDFDK